MLNVLIDFGGTNIKMALMKDHEMLYIKSIPSLSKDGINPKLAEVKQCISDMLLSQVFQLKDLNTLGVCNPWTC